MTVLNPQKRARKTAYKIDRQLRELFKKSDEFKVCMLDQNGRIVAWNKSAQRITGYKPKDVLGKSYSMFLSKEDIHRHTLDKALTTARKKGSFATEGIRVRKDGSHFWASTSITPINENGKDRLLFVVITRNISEEKEREQKKEEYIGIASHELRNPIQTLSLYSELLEHRMQLTNNKKDLHMLHDMKSQTARLVSLVDDLMMVSKIESGTMELQISPFDMNALVKKLVQEFQVGSPKQKIYIKGKVDRPVKADKAKVTQVFVNLLSNAAKYSPKADKIHVTLKKQTKKCVVSIRDFGSGIAKKDQRNIFTRYFRADDAKGGSVAGVGLGLYIAKEIIKKHRERLWVSSTLGKGSTFSFTLSSS
jgi:PAS domain S-box-containing protein